jgi:Tol biopolymer transport system component
MFLPDGNVRQMAVIVPRTVRRLLAALVVIGAWSPMPPASAAYPGTEGRIAFVRDGAIWTAAANGSDQVQLTRIGVASSPVWSPDGERIAFGWLRLSSGTRTDIWTMAADGSDKRQITAHVAADSSPTWSPDGRFLAFQSDRRDIGHGVGEIFKIRSSADAALRARRLTDGGDGGADIRPAWSPLGDVIAFNRTFNRDQCTGCSSYEVWTVTPDGTTEARVSIEHPRAESPAWSPFAKRIAFTYGVQDDQGRYVASNLYHVAPDGTDIRTLTAFVDGTFNRAFTPAWSPDHGRRILFTYYADYEEGWIPSIWRIGSRGLTEPVQLIANGEDPDWQPL